ncbi:MAG: helix-turn-helix transcriptional regulator [Desulfobulbaceae bacterium]|nr:helix-turn-helix transcriptional regulator [Desulfobulbaceae bacterium]
MTGSEFRAIRRFNKFSQRTISAKTGIYVSDSAVKEIERGSKVPHFFVKILSWLMGLDLSKEDILRKQLDGIPEKFFHAKICTRKPKPKSAVIFPPTGSIYG